MDDIQRDIYSNIASELIKDVIKRLLKIIQYTQQDKDKVSDSIHNHIIDVLEWASIIQLFGMSSPDSTDNTTIALDFASEPRRFQSKEIITTKQESDLLSEPNHILLLGEPGSGKTTTIKRIALKVVREPPSSNNDQYQYPIVILLRELQDGESLFERIAKIFGLGITNKKYGYEIDVVDDRGKHHKETAYRFSNLIGDQEVADVIPLYLEAAPVLLLLDGLDELEEAHAKSILREIEILRRRLISSKIILSYRSGEYSTQMEGFSTLEICPLKQEQILIIKNKWLGSDDTKFMEEFRKLPYYDVANRPLLLTQLLILYKSSGYLPDRPCEIYHKLVKLLLEEWDEQRIIKRITKYTGFTPNRKAEFLDSLSYHLTYPIQKTRFTHEDLRNAYLQICERFSLPKDEAEQVAAEIQTHTGIIAISRGGYEFCHRSLQEYLCAEYLVRVPLPTLSPHYLVKYTAPLAVAVSLSLESGNWFGTLILRYGYPNYFTKESMLSFLTRLKIERPVFGTSVLLGFALLVLYKNYGYDPQICQLLDEITQMDGVLKSIILSLKYYDPNDGKPNSGLIPLRLEKSLVNPFEYDIPSDGAIPNKLIARIRKIQREPLYAREINTKNYK